MSNVCKVVVNHFNNAKGSSRYFADLKFREEQDYICSFYLTKIASL